MLRRPLLTLLFVLFSCLPARAEVDWAQLSQRIYDDPVSVSREARTLWQQYQHANDERNELAAILLLLQSKFAIEEYSELDTLLPRGLTLARAQDNAAAEARLMLADVRRLVLDAKADAANRLLDRIDALCTRHELGREQALAHVERALLLQDEGRFNEALPLLFKAHQLQQKLGLSQDASNTLTDIGNAYSAMDNNGQAAAYYQRSLAGLDKDHARHALSVRLYNLGSSLHQNKQWNIAERNLREALRYSEALHDDTGIAFANYRLGTILLAKQEPAKALPLLDRALVEFRRGNNLDLVFSSHIARAEALAQTAEGGQPAMKALAAAEEISAQAPNMRRQLVLHEGASRVYKHLGRYVEALSELENWARIYRSNNEQINRQQLGEMQARFDVARREAENNLLKSEQRRQSAELEASRSRRILLGAGLGVSILLALALVLLLVRQGQQKRRFSDLAMRDELTGAPNRRHIMQYANQQLDACRAVRQPFTLAVIDLDHFKSINDQYGHDVGDRVLKHFASATQAVLRRGDRLGRIGGEEWLLVMPNTEAQEAEPVFARLRHALQSSAVDGLPAEHRLSFSMGAAQLKDGEVFDQLLHAADEAMYHAKQGGRDRLQLRAVSDTQNVSDS